MRALKILVAVGVVAVAGLGTSAPAMAAANPSIVSVTCNDPNVCTAGVWSAGSLMANPGDAFTVHNGVTNLFSSFTILKDGASLQSVDVAPSAAASMTAPSAVGDYTLRYIGVGSADGYSIPLTVTNDPIAPAPPPVPIIGLQQVGVPASGDCADVPVSVGHDQGFPIGGWSKSWARWINNGQGGAVCTRTVEQIDNADGTSRLVVNP
jgi:hypothetical protein|tara:strand:+ start:2122 stop:2745 length:624 start_codon:yes stop_codon:yes gene_type:complete